MFSWTAKNRFGFRRQEWTESRKGLADHSWERVTVVGMGRTRCGGGLTLTLGPCLFDLEPCSSQSATIRLFIHSLIHVLLSVYVHAVLCVRS